MSCDALRRWFLAKHRQREKDSRARQHGDRENPLNAANSLPSIENQHASLSIAKSTADCGKFAANWGKFDAFY